MKKIIPFFALLFVFATVLSAQSFDEGLSLYENEQFDEAYAIFSNLDDERAHLFAGKSLLATGKPLLGINYFDLAAQNAEEGLRQEAIYSKALAHFRLKNYQQSLELLNSVLRHQDRTAIRRDAQRLYDEIIQFLSTEQRFSVLYSTESGSLRYDLVRASSEYLNEASYHFMVSEFLKTITDTDEKERLERNLMNRRASGNEHRFPNAPEGTVYNIGVVLPAFEPDDPNFTIPRNLYYGMLLAADEFNSRNSDKKVQLIFKNSAEDPDTTTSAFNELVWSRQVDAVIGPLFSQPATRMALLAEEYRVPMLAPLANSDDLNLNYNYTFQMNPTFSVHGKNMARYAVEELRLDTLAVITEPNSLGRASAMAFRHEAERLGAHISYFFEEDFEATGFDLTHVTEVFTPDPALIDSLGLTQTDGIYAPFTGQAAETLTNLLLNDLEAMRSEVVVMGSEEWSNFSLTGFQNQQFEIYYTESFGEASDGEIEDFFIQDYESRFGSSPDRFSRLGYDSANILFQSFETAGNPVYLTRALQEKTQYNGLSLTVNFDGQRINQHVFIRPLSDRARQRMER